METFSCNPLLHCLVIQQHYLSYLVQDSDFKSMLSFRFDSHQLCVYAIPADRIDDELGDGPPPVKGRAVGRWHGSEDALPFFMATSEVFIVWEGTRILLHCPFHGQTPFIENHIRIHTIPLDSSFPYPF